MQTSENWPSRPSGYSLEQVIGKGAFGVVYSAKVLSGLHTNQKVAIKKIDLEDFPDHSLEDIRQELLLTRLSLHPNVVSYHTSFLSSHYLWLVMPLFEGGSVGCILKQKFPYGVKDISLVASILKDTLSALAYFHQNRQIHRDVKAANLLVNGDGRVMLSDFGVAAKLKQGMNAKTFVGSPCWMAPEVIDSDNYRGYDYKADIWSFGILAIELAKGCPPYSDQLPMKVIMLVLNKEPPLLSKNENLDSAFKELVNACLQKDPAKRPSAQSLLNKSFFKKAKGPQYIKYHLLEYLPPLTARVVEEQKAPEENKLSEKMMSGDWDFSLSGEYSKKPKEPLEELGLDEEDPLESIGEFD